MRRSNERAHGGPKPPRLPRLVVLQAAAFFFAGGPRLTPDGCRIHLGGNRSETPRHRAGLFDVEVVDAIRVADRALPAVVERLVRSGADVDHRGANRMTAMHGAASNGHVEVVGILLEARADRRMRNVSDETALDLAEAAGHRDVADLIKTFRLGGRRWLESSPASTPP